MNFIVFDLEATCWLGRPPKGVNEVIEIGALKVNAYGETIDRFNYFVKPIVNPVLSFFCKRLTSINQQQINRASIFPRVIEHFKDWINTDEDYLLCSWGKFDIQLLRNDCQLHKIEDDWLQHNINVKAQYHQNRKRTEFSGLKSTIKKEGFEFLGVHHRAISDAENLCQIFVKYIDEWQY